MKILNAEQTVAALPYDALISALSEGIQQTFNAPLRHHHYLKNEAEDDAVLLLMPAWFDETWGGEKMVNVVPGNAKRGLASISSSYILFNRRTGVHELLLDGAELTARRTAAAAALAASNIARPNSHTHLIVGAGRVGSCIPHAYKAVLPIKEISTVLFYRCAPQRLRREDPKMKLRFSKLWVRRSKTWPPQFLRKKSLANLNFCFVAHSADLWRLGVVSRSSVSHP